jgi:two-component system, cell cycle response regulator
VAALAALRPDRDAEREAFRTAVARLGEAMGATHDREKLVRVTIESVLQVTSAETVLFWRDARGTVQVVAGCGADGERRRRVDRGAGLTGHVLATAQTVRWPGGPAVPEPAEDSAVALAVPIVANGSVYGVLTLHRDAGPPFGDEEVADVVDLARQVGVAVEATYLHEEARRLSLTDGLTNLWNRRQFELRALQERERAIRFGERFAVVLIDLDGFKAVNDTHGHLVGDMVLVETANRLATHTRDVDTVARFGGEEFVLLLPQTDAAGALRVAEKVRAELAAKPVDTDAGPLPVTLSAGVASHPDDGDSLDELLATADEALYAAKAAGKNRVHHVRHLEPGATPS